MADKITTYSEQTARNILARLDRLEMRQNTLLSGGLTQSFPQGVLPTRWARTCTSPESPTYPTTGNVVAVEFGDYEPSPLSAGSTAIKTFTAYDPQVSVLATGDNSPLPFQGQVVPVVWRNGKWWYLHPNFRRAIASASISAGSSGNAALYDDTTNMGTRTVYYTWADTGKPTIASGDEIFVAWFDAEQKWVILPMGSGGGTTIPECYLHGIRVYRPTDGYVSNRYVKYDRTPGSVYWTDSIGDVTGCNLTVNTASVTAYTNYGLKVTAAGYYDFDWRCSAYDVTASSAKGKYQATTDAGGAISAHSHTFTGDANTTSSDNVHSHTISSLGAYSTDNAAAHTHTLTPTGAISSAGSAASHTHTVDVPHGMHGISAGFQILWRASGGTESDWDLLAQAWAQFRNFPSLSQTYLGHYVSAAPRGMLYLDANTELVFRVGCSSPQSSGSQWDDAACQVVSLPAYTNCRVRYLGASLTTTSHYP